MRNEIRNLRGLIGSYIVKDVERSLELHDKKSNLEGGGHV